LRAVPKPADREEDNGKMKTQTSGTEFPKKSETRDFELHCKSKKPRGRPERTKGREENGEGQLKEKKRKSNT